MSTTISEHQARVYEYAKTRGERWFTTQELSSDANVPANTAKAHAARFEEIGVFERIRISPAHAFRIDADARKHAPKMVARLEEAVEIFTTRRLDWLQREQAAFDRLNDRESPPTAAEPTARPINELATMSSATEVSASGPTVVQIAPQVSQPPEEIKSTTLGLTVPRRDKVDILFGLIGRPEGASLEELAAALGNLPHSIRATISVKSRERGIPVRCQGGRYFLD